MDGDDLPADGAPAAPTPGRSTTSRSHRRTPRSAAWTSGRGPTRWTRSPKAGGRSARSPHGSCGTTTWRAEPGAKARRPPRPRIAERSNRRRNPVIWNAHRSMPASAADRCNDTCSKQGDSPRWNAWRSWRTRHSPLPYFFGARPVARSPMIRCAAILPGAPDHAAAGVRPGAALVVAVIGVR